MYRIEWCDLGIAQLRIISTVFWKKKKVKVEESSRNRKKIINIYVLSNKEFQSKHFNSEIYREKMMQKGIYIGHHCGEPVNIKIVDKFNIIISAKDPDTIIWSFVYKYVLTILTIGSEFLHLKAGAVTYHDGAILIAGRGGGGKTTMIDRVCDENIRYMGNTHIIFSFTFGGN